MYNDPPWMNHYYCGCAGNPQCTVKHFLVECPLPVYVTMREEMKLNLSEIDSQFSNEEYFNDIKHLIFPHLQFKYKELKNHDNLIKCVHILMIIANYCRYRFPD